MTMAFRPSDFAGASVLGAGWRRHLIALAGAWAALLTLFHHDVGDLAGIYWNSTTYGHCLFIAPVVGWLMWQRRAGLALVTPVGWWPGLALVAAGGLAWAIGDMAGVALFRHAGLVVMMQGAVVAVLGPNVTRAVLFPIAYLLFLVPFGDFMEASLQSVTVAMTMKLLALAGVPASVDGVLITTPNGYFEVAEACSGAKFVIAMVAFGVLVANVCYIGWRKRIAFMAMALIVPVIANGIRAFGTIYAAFHTSVEAATGFDHIVYGWVFFAVVMAGVLAIGWHWFDRDPDAPWFDPARFQAVPKWRSDAITATGGVIGVAVLFLGWATLVAARVAPLPPQIDLPTVNGWQRVAATGTPWVPNYPGADHFVIGRYRDTGGAVVDVAIAVYASQREGRELVAFGQGAIRENDIWVRIADMPDIAGAHVVRMTAPGPVERETATWYRVGDTTTGDDTRVKLATLQAKLLGGSQAGVAVLISAPRDGQDSRAAITRFVAASGGIDRIADRATGTTR